MFHLPLSIICNVFSFDSTHILNFNFVLKSIPKVNCEPEYVQDGVRISRYYHNLHGYTLPKIHVMQYEYTIDIIVCLT